MTGNAITEGARVRWRKCLHSYLGHIVDAQPDGHGRERVATDRGAVVPIQVERLEILSQPAQVVPLTRTPHFDVAPLRAVPKKLPVRDDSYLGWLRTLPCCVCGLEGYTEASHHGLHGMATKASDLDALPLCSAHHRRWHSKHASPHPSWDLLDREQVRERLAFYARQYREPKGASIKQMVENDTRVLKPMYRAAGADSFKEVEWDWALDQIARKVKDTRDRTFKVTSKSKVKEKQPDGTEKEVEKDFTVNRTDAIAHVGSAALDNEECYLFQKMLRSWGLVYIEHQARI